MFLKRIPFEETSKRRIRHWLLLAIRLAALGLLVAAFARPFVRGGALASVGGPGPEEVVILLDRSYSMELGDHWQQAVDRAKAVAAALRPRDRVSLVTFSETPHLLHRSMSDPAPGRHPGHPPHGLPRHTHRPRREAGPLDPRGLRAAPASAWSSSATSSASGWRPDPTRHCPPR